MIRDRDLQARQEVRTLLRQAQEAQRAFKEFSQDQVDKIFAFMATAGYHNSHRLAKMAVEETGYGKVDDKSLKNQFATRFVYEAWADLKTVGIINRDEQNKVIEIAEPMGVVAAIIPTTNPTSTALYKALIAVKARNAVVFSPHPRAAKCTYESVRIMARAAEEAGAPAGLISCMTQMDMAGTEELMHARETAVILATGGPGLVRAAYSAGKPAFGVGPGNVPIYIDRSAQLEKAVRDVIRGKTFDWGTLCSSEQALVVDAPVYEQTRQLLVENGAYFLDEKQAAVVGRILVFENGMINPELVGHSPQAIAAVAGISIPDSVKVLVAEQSGIGKEFPLSREKLSPVLAMYRVQDWQDGCDHCIRLLNLGGRGHTLGIHATDEQVIMQFALHKPAFRIVVNTPSSLGAVGATTGLDPALTLGCGTYGGNISADNISPKNLLNIKRLAYETSTGPEMVYMYDLGKWNATISWEDVSHLRERHAGYQFPYQKALEGDVSRKGSYFEKKQDTPAARPAPAPAQQPASAPAPPNRKTEMKYGKDGLGGEQVDAIVEQFLRERGLQ